MGPASSSTIHKRHTLPASLIFTPSELKQYRRWQNLHTTLRPSDQGFIPTATEYDEFQQWLRKQDSGYFSDVFEDISEHIQPPPSAASASYSEPAIGSVCRHTLHPVAAGKPCARCPVCTVDIHLNYMRLLTRSFQNANGRPLPRTGTPSEQQENMYCAWSRAKVNTLRQVSELEDMAAEETRWSGEHPQVHFDDVQTAAKAVEIYWSETAGCRSQRQCTRKSRTIGFSEDTNFSPGRPVTYFLKSSPRYEPGKYTLLENESAGDDAVSEDSEDYSQTTVFMMGGSREHDERCQEEASMETHIEDPYEDIESDDGDCEWEDVESEEEGDESSDGSYICFETSQEANFVIFAND
jgi:hypothetical protein